MISDLVVVAVALIPVVALVTALVWMAGASRRPPEQRVLGVRSPFAPRVFVVATTRSQSR